LNQFLGKTLVVHLEDSAATAALCAMSLMVALPMTERAEFLSQAGYDGTATIAAFAGDGHQVITARLC
jgi:hypothetical protein